mgnify:CR=1 FL=1
MNNDKRRRSLSITGFIAACAILATSSARAQLPVVDPANLAQNVQQVLQAIEQIRNQVRQIETVTSHSGYGALGDGAVERAARRYAPNSWEDALRVLESGGLPGNAGDLGDTLGALRETYGALSAEELAGARVSDRARSTFARTQSSGLLAEALSSAAFAQIETRIGSVEAMLSEIDTAPDIKAAADLQARIGGEMALAQIELARLQAASDARQAQDANRRAAAQAEMLRFLAVTPQEADSGVAVMLDPR